MGVINDHTTALVPIDTWAYQSPELKQRGEPLDMELFAEALVYYDRVLLVPATDVSVGKVIQSPEAANHPDTTASERPLFVEFIDWFVRRGLFAELLSLLADGTLSIYHYAFRLAVIERHGVYQIVNAQEEDDKRGRAFQRRVLYHPALEQVLPKSRSRDKLFRTIETRIVEVAPEQFAPAVENARRDFVNELAVGASVQAFLDDAHSLAGMEAAPSVNASVTQSNERINVTWNVDFDAIGRAVGPSVGFNPGLVISGLAQANRSLWSAATSSSDLFLPQPLSRLASRKLAEGDDRRARIAGVIGELEAKVEFPDVRRLVNSGTLSFGDVLKLRRNARQFRDWLQTQAERDRDALIAYHHEIARRSGFTRGAIRTLKLFGAVTGAVAGSYAEGPLGAAIGGTTGGPIVDAAVRVVDQGVRYVFDLAGKLDEDWKPVVFGDWARDYVRQIETSRRRDTTKG